MTKPYDPRETTQQLREEIAQLRERVAVLEQQLRGLTYPQQNQFWPGYPFTPIYGSGETK